MVLTCAVSHVHGAPYIQVGRLVLQDLLAHLVTHNVLCTSLRLVGTISSLLTPSASIYFEMCVKVERLHLMSLRSEFILYFHIL